VSHFGGRHLLGDLVLPAQRLNLCSCIHFQNLLRFDDYDLYRYSYSIRDLWENTMEQYEKTFLTGKFFQCLTDRLETGKVLLLRCCRNITDAKGNEFDVNSSGKVKKKKFVVDIWKMTW